MMALESGYGELGSHDRLPAYMHVNECRLRGIEKYQRSFTAALIRLFHSGVGDTAEQAVFACKCWERTAYG
jgi:hypothetical protein